MTRSVLLVAALLLINLGGIAAAAEPPEHKSKNAQKLIATLESVGINRKEIKDFISQANTHVSHGYVYLAERKIMGGEVSLRYSVGGSKRLGPSYSSRRLELHYSPKANKNLHVIAKTDMVLVRYHLEY